MAEFVRWREATEAALYGPDGFFRRAAGPAAHFRTSVHASPLFAGAVPELLRRVDAALGHPDPIHVVDIGAGHGELLVTLAAAAANDRTAGDRHAATTEPSAAGGPATGPASAAASGPTAEAGGEHAKAASLAAGGGGAGGRGLAGRLRLVGVERAARPDGLPAGIEWSSDIPRCTGLLVANEWLDNVPVDVVELDSTGTPRFVLVDPATGDETLGDPANDPWLDRWWPLLKPGDRAELGTPRDEAWARAVASLDAGLALAVDYGHVLATRPSGGTLTGYAHGRQVVPVPDGSCDLTAHVAMDAVAAAGEKAGAQVTVRTSQRDALRDLGVNGARPPIALASTDPAAYLRALTRASEAGELLARGGLGDFHWLAQAVGIPAPLAPAPGHEGA